MSNQKFLLEKETIVSNVRALAGVDAESGGPDDAHILAGVRGFVEAFDYWYIRVMREAVPNYRNLIIKRINPFIRRVEFGDSGSSFVASKLVEDYNSRNFVTAGGWALEELASAASPEAQKSSAEGIDLQRFEPHSGDYFLYVLKSGLVTRNSDIVKALKRNARQAEKLLKQGRSTGAVHANYVILAGKTSSTFEDGVRRPSSAEFWGEILDLPEESAVELALAMAAEAGRMVQSDASEHVEALKLLVETYLRHPDDPSLVDWEFIAKRNMSKPATWKSEDKARHLAALAALTATGYFETLDQ